MKYLLDSVILIDHFNGIAAATQFLAEEGSACAMSVITRAEVLAGFGDVSLEPALELLDQFPALPITVEVADRAARLRRSERWKLPDAVQAALAMHHELTLVTRNRKGFRGGDALKLVVPYRV